MGRMDRIEQKQSDNFTTETQRRQRGQLPSLCSLCLCGKIVALFYPVYPAHPEKKITGIAVTTLRLIILAHLIQEVAVDGGILGEFGVERSAEVLALADEDWLAIVGSEDLDFWAACDDTWSTDEEGFTALGWGPF